MCDVRRTFLFDLTTERAIAVILWRAFHSRPLILDNLLPVFQMQTLDQVVTPTTLAADHTQG